MSTTTLKLRKTLIILVSIALLLAPNLIAFADDTPSGEQGTPTPVPSQEASAAPSEEVSDEPTEVPAPPATSPETTETQEASEETPSPDSSEQPSQEPTDTASPPSAPEATQTEQAGEETPSPTPTEQTSQEPTDPAPPARALDATQTDESGDPTPPTSGEETTSPEVTPAARAEFMAMDSGAKGFGGPPSGTTAELTIQNVSGDKNYTVNYTYWDSGFLGIGSGWKTKTDTKSPGDSFSVRKGTTVTITANANTSDHYVFTKWNTPNSTSNPVSFTMPNSNYTVQAQFTKTHYDLVLKNSFNLNHYTVKYGSSEINVYVSGHSNTIQVPNGAAVSVIAYADSNYEFESWDESPGNHNENPTSFTMNGNYSVRADFQRSITYDMTFVNVTGLNEYSYSWTWRHSWDILGLFERSGNGTASGGQSKSFYKGAEVTVSASVLSGYTHTGWVQPSSSTASSIDVTMSSAKTVEATIMMPQATLQFHYVEGLAAYSCTADGNPVAIATPTAGNPTTVMVPAGSNVAVSATAQGTHSLTGWETSDPYDGNSVNPAVSEQTYDFKAVFERTGYILDLDLGTGVQNYTVEFNGTSGAYGDADVIIPLNAAVTLTANPKPNYGFDHWSATVSPSTADMHGNVWKFNMEGNYTDVKATFGQLSGDMFKITYDDVSFGPGSGKVAVYYPSSSSTPIATLSKGQSKTDIHYITGENTVKVVALPDSSSVFVQWTNHGNVTTPTMLIDLITGQGSPEAALLAGAKCYVTFEIHVRPEFEKRGSLTISKVVQDDYSQKLDGAKFSLTGISLSYYKEQTTAGGGIAQWLDLKEGTYRLQEIAAPTGYKLNTSTWLVTIGESGGISIEAKTIQDPWHVYGIIPNESEHCSLEVNKVNPQGATIAAYAVFRLTGPNSYSSVQESYNGYFLWEDLEPGDYTLTELQAPSGYYWETATHNVTLTAGTVPENHFEQDVTNYEYVSIQVQKKSKLTGEALANAVFMISVGETDLGTVTTGSDGIATFAFDDFLLKAGVQYKVREITPPTGYLNDSEPVYITVAQHGGINPLSEGIFENTPYQHALTVVKYLGEVPVSGIGDGSLLDGLEFELFKYEGESWVSQGIKALANGTCEFANLLPGDYKIVELGTGNSFAQYMTLDGEKEVTIELMNESTNSDVEFFNSYEDAEFSIIKHDSQNPLIVLEGAIYHLKGMAWNGSGFEERTYVLETNSYGYAEVRDLTPGMYTLQEIQAPPHYDIDPDIYSVEILPGRSVEEVYFVENDKLATLVLAKFQSGTNDQTRIFGAVFSLYKGSVAAGNLISQKTTDSNGNIVWSDLVAGNYVLVEDSAPSGFTIKQKSYNITLDIGERQVLRVYNDGPTPTPTVPTNPPLSTPTPTPSPTPTPVPTATPTPVNTDELTIEDVDPAFGPETGEGNGLFIMIAILLLMASALFIIRKKTVLKSK